MGRETMASSQLQPPRYRAQSTTLLKGRPSLPMCHAALSLSLIRSHCLSRVCASSTPALDPPSISTIYYCWSPRCLRSQLRHGMAGQTFKRESVCPPLKTTPSPAPTQLPPRLSWFPFSTTLQVCNRQSSSAHLSSSSPATVLKDHFCTQVARVNRRSGHTIHKETAYPGFNPRPNNTSTCC